MLFCDGKVYMTCGPVVIEGRLFHSKDRLRLKPIKGHEEFNEGDLLELVVLKINPRVMHPVSENVEGPTVLSNESNIPYHRLSEDDPGWVGLGREKKDK